MLRRTEKRQKKAGTWISGSVLHHSRDWLYADNGETYVETRLTRFVGTASVYRWSYRYGWRNESCARIRNRELYVSLPGIITAII